MTMPLKMPKVKTLRDDIRSKGWHIIAFMFHYNHHEYIVLFEDAKSLQCKSQYTIAYITFIDRKDINRILSASANTMGFDRVSLKRMMDYFYISYVPSAKGFISSFCEHFNDIMPIEYRPPLDNDIKKAVITRLGVRDKESNPESQYCFDVRRNSVIDGKQRHRSIFNSNKAKLLREPLYERLKDDTTLSFYFSPDPNKNLPDVDILAKMARRGIPRI